MRNRILLGLICSLLLTTGGSAQNTSAAPASVIYAGWLLDVPGTPAKRDRTIVVRDGKIVAVHPGHRSPSELGLGSDTKIVDLSSQFVLPGLIDCHVHLTSISSPQAMLQGVTRSDADRAVLTTIYARQTLAAGFTTVRELGSRGSAIFAVRDRIADGSIPGPRIIAAGSTLTPTGGHADVNGYIREIAEVLRSPSACNGADDCRRAVREQVKRGADVIKVTATGGVMSVIEAGFGQQLTDDELKAIVEAAHALGRRVAAHALDKAGIDAALRAGVDSIEHGTYADEASYALFRKNGTYIVPTMKTIEVAERVADPASGFTPAQRKKAQQALPHIRTALRGMYRAGVKVAFGTDAGTFPHGENAGEFKHLVGAGLSPMQALQAATVNAANLLGLSAEIGTLEPGKVADIVAVAGNPLEDVGVLLKPTFVMYRGIVYKAEP